jgi:hypothetical protein
MGTSLTGLTPATTYDALIKVGDNGPIDGTLKTLSDGLGNDLPMQASTAAVNFTGALTQSGVALQAVLVSGTNIKTINSTTLLGSGDVAVQPTLVSGTNIKTINSTSLLGSGDIAISASPSGVSGAIQFSNGSAFASDAANLFWDDTNNRLGVGTNAPSATGHFKGSGSTSATTSLLVQNSAGTQVIKSTDNGTTQFGAFDASASVTQPLAVTSSGSNTAGIALYASGSGNAGMDYYRNGAFKFNVGIGGGSDNFAWYNGAFGNYSFYILSDATGRTVFGGTTGSASAQLSVDSTTRGFLPPRMTTTQKNAIATPAAGLVLYDSTTNKLQCYNGSTWNDLF